MSKAIVFLFSGQGSQSFHMGREISENCPEVRERLLALDVVAQRVLGRSVLEIMFDPARKRVEAFDRLLYSNPALFMLQYALADALIAQGARPAALMGASLGEVVALTVAGALTPEDALSMVIALSDACENHGEDGGLVAVLANPKLVVDRAALFDGVEIAGISSDKHFIAAGPADRVARIAEELGAECPCMVLPVRFPFHSSYMESASPVLQPIFAGRGGAALRLPVMSCVDAAPLDTLAEDHLWRVVRSPMRIADAYQALEARQDSLFVDLSPSGTMASLAKYNLGAASRSEACSVMSLFGNEWTGYQAVRQRLGIAA